MGKRKRGEGEAEDVVLSDDEVTEDGDAMLGQAPDVMPDPDLAGYQQPEPPPIVGPAGTAPKAKTTLLERQILERGERVTVESFLDEMERYCASGGTIGLDELRALKRVAILV